MDLCFALLCLHFYFAFSIPSKSRAGKHFRQPSTMFLVAFQRSKSYSSCDQRISLERALLSHPCCFAVSSKEFHSPYAHRAHVRSSGTPSVDGQADATAFASQIFGDFCYSFPTELFRQEKTTDMLTDNNNLTHQNPR